MKLSTLAVLSEEEIQLIHDSSLSILEECGVKILDPETFDFLKGKGCRTDAERNVVYFPRSSVEDAIAAVPNAFDVFDRNGKCCFTLGDGESKVAAGHNAVNWVDSNTGRTRPSTVADVELFSRLCQQLECIHMIGIPVMPQDVAKPEASLLYAVKAVIENSEKPVFFSTDNARINGAVIEQLRTVFKGDMKEEPYGITQLSSTSPLYWEAGVLRAITETIPKGVPIALLPEPIAGISAPYTLAGLLTMHNTEMLSGLAVIQMLAPGTKVMYGASWTTSNMLNGAALVGSTESSACRIAGTQLARFYQTPSHTTAPNSDNHSHDEQNAWEKTLSMFCSVGARTDLIVNCGMFATGMTCSNEQLLMDEAISAYCRRIAEGIVVDGETVASELIKDRGPQGETYLTSDHTLRWLRSREYVRPRLTVTGPYAAWLQNGGKDTYQLARERVADMGSTAAGAQIGEERKARLQEIIDDFGIEHNG
jgi:trimethylamine--corrinoid protein Co-methyltransferase